jgi:hypothetical protein
LNGSIGLLIGELELGGGSMELGGTTVEESVGQGAADTLVKEDEHPSNPDGFFGELVGVSGSVTGEQGMGFELAQVITELGQVSGLSWKVERRALGGFGGSAIR